MLLTSHIKVARTSIRGARWRSLLTMLGIIIGVASVVTTVSLGEGVKHQIAAQIRHLGPDLITVQSGHNRGGLNFLAPISSNLTEADLRTLQATSGVKVAIPLGMVTALPHTADRQLADGSVIATTDGLAEILNQPVEFGSFFGSADSNKRVAVIGSQVAEQLFNELAPIGKSILIKDQTYAVIGVFAAFPHQLLATTPDYNRSVFIPYETAKQLSGGQLQLYQLLAKPHLPQQTEPTAETVRATLLKNHSGQADFTVLTQAENLTATSDILNLLTGLIAGIAAISLLVGGIGIMNIMLVTVTERTQEIGVRKAVGATNRQILSQFLIEALVLSSLGGLIGILVALLANYLIRILTTAQPVISLPVVLVSTVVAMLVGIIFGITPALKAARKDPIDALRQH